jgi:hypothetical protein
VTTETRLFPGGAPPHARSQASFVAPAVIPEMIFGTGAAGRDQGGVIPDSAKSCHAFGRGPGILGQIQNYSVRRPRQFYKLRSSSFERRLGYAWAKRLCRR